MNTRVVTIIVLIGICTASCKSTRPSTFRPEDFAMPGCALVLAFDLRNDDQPVAGFSIDEALHPVGVQNMVVLPFPAEAVQMDEAIFATVGEYCDFTLVGYAVPEARHSVAGIGLLPVLQGLPDRPLFLDDVAPGVYLDRSGLDRTFIYHYRALDNPIWAKLALMRQFLTKPIDAVAVALPSNSKGREIDGGRTEVPEHTYQAAVARFFPAAPPDPAIKTIRVGYEVPANTRQERFGKMALKLLAAVAAPLLALGFLPSKDTTRPRLRRAGIRLMIVLQIMVLAVLIVLWIQAPSSLGWQILEDLPTIIIGSVFTGIVLWAKK